MTTVIHRAAIVLSGNELLDGRTRDINGAYVSADLSARGVKVLGVMTVADDRARLIAALRDALRARPDLLVIGGGLGTTHDDLTAECLAEVLGSPLREDATALDYVAEGVRRVAARRDLDSKTLMTLARRQALLPKGATAVPPAGLAPGIAAVHEGARVFALPGVPSEFEAMWAGIAGRLAAEGAFPGAVVHTLRIYGAGELQIAPLLDDVPHELLETSITVGAGEVTVRLRHGGGERAAAEAAAVVDVMRTGAPVFSDDGRTIDEMVADGLRDGKLTVAVAESCTGGLLGARLTATPGSSEYFVGGVISYANAIKTGALGVPAATLAEHGAVSREVGDAMATGARALTGADYALAVTGVAGPDGGTPEKPVGLVYVACAGPLRSRVERHVFPGDRASVRDYATTCALHLLCEELRS